MMVTNKESRFDWAGVIKLGLLGGIVAIYCCLVGLVETFSDAYIIEDLITFGRTLLILTAMGVGYFAAARTVRVPRALLGSALAGLLAGGLIALFLLIVTTINLRMVFINVSPGLIGLLRFNQQTAHSVLVLLIGGALAGGLAGAISLSPRWAQSSLLLGVAVITAAGLLHDRLRVLLADQELLAPLSRFFFASSGMTRGGATVLFLAAAGLMAAWSLGRRRVRERVGSLPLGRQTALRWAGIIFSLLFLLILPILLGTYLTSVVDTVGRFVLLGLGLNIVVGFAGLLDLGYVAFYAVGAYTVAILTTTSPVLGGAQLSFWLALPIAIGASVLASILLGLPALRIRGDYLAIVTLGFGHIVGKLAASNWLKAYTGGAQGIILIPRPVVFGQELDTVQSLYYLILVGCAIAFFISWRLRDSRLGLIWMATRDDEDVAGALGIDLLKTRLLAYAMGAAFAGAAGAILATQTTAIFPQNFHLAISINVLCLIVVGGIGSLPGVIVGSLLMVGLPEALVELQGHRILYTSATLVLVMLVRFGHLLPRASRERE